MLTLNLLNAQTVLVALTVGLLVYVIRRRFIYRLPPGPWAIPLIGNFEVYTKPLLHRVILQLSKKYGPIIQFSFGPIPTVFLNNYEVVMEALVKRKADFAGRPTSVTFSLISEGFRDIALASYSPMWQYHRRVAVKALRNYLQGDLLEKLTQDNMTKVMNMMAAEKGPIVVKSHMDNIVFYQLYTLCFGEKKEIGDPDVEFLLREKDNVNKAIGNGLREDLLPFLKDVYPSRRYVIIKEAVDRAFSFLYKLLQEHKETFDPNNIRDLTDHLLLARSAAEKSGDDESLEKLNDTYLVQTVSDIFFAGVDTTRMTLEWFLCFISGLPEIQAKCQAEIDKTIGQRCPSIADRQSLPYTEACLYETMRVGVIAGLGLPHLTICDTQVGGYDIPKGTVVLINHFALHRDSKYWKDPEKFDPLRYLDESGKMDPTKLDSWLPFSAGRRVCLGESIAKPEILMMCVHLLQRFKISLPEGVKPNFVVNTVLTSPQEFNTRNATNLQMLQLTSLNVQTVLVALTVGLLVYVIRRRFIYRLPPGPWAIPLIGNFEVYSKPMMHRTLFDLSKKYGPVFRVHFGPAPVVVLNSYEVVNEALVKRKSDFAGRPPLTTFELISEGFKDIAFATYSPMWRFHKRVATMALRNCLHGDLLEKLTEDNMRKVLDMMAAETGPFSLQSHLENIIYYQLFTLCFGEKKDIGDPDVVLLSSTKEVLNQNFGNGLMEDILPVLKDVYPSKRYLNIKEGLQKIHAFFYKNLETHKDSFDPRNPRDLTDHLLLERFKAEEDGNAERSEKLNDTYVVQTLSDVFHAGVDTTTMVLKWFICFMSGLPHIQAQCQKEIDGNIGRRCPSINDRQVLPYTEACIYETMRRGVTVGLAQPHLTMCDTQVGGYDVPKDTAVLINLFAVHQDPKRWPEPEKFDPFRYLDEKGKTDPAKLESWLQFSTGIRVCLGKSLAQAEIFLICVHLLQRFQILLPGGVERNFEGKHSIFFGTEEPIDLKIVVKERLK